MTFLSAGVSFECDCGKIYSTIVEMLDCKYSHHENFHDVEMQLRNLKAIIPNCESVHCHISDGFSIFWACIRDDVAISDRTYAGLIEKAEALRI